MASAADKLVVDVEVAMIGQTRPSSRFGGYSRTSISSIASTQACVLTRTAHATTPRYSLLDLRWSTDRDLLGRLLLTSNSRGHRFNVVDLAIRLDMDSNSAHSSVMLIYKVECSLTPRYA